MNLPSREWWAANSYGYQCTYCDSWARWYDTRHEEMLCPEHKSINNTPHLYMEELED